MEPSHTARRPKAWVALALLAGAALIVWIVKQRSDAWRYPWADADSGHPVLLGTWVGQLTTGSGRPRVLSMEIARHERSHGRHRRCRGCEDGITGMLRTCDEQGRVVGYVFNGAPDDRDATQLHGTTQPADSPAPDGLSISGFRGSWDRADALSLSLQFYMRRGAAAITSSDDPDTRGWVTAPLRRGSSADFAQHCQTIVDPPGR